MSVVRLKRKTRKLKSLCHEFWSCLYNNRRKVGSVTISNTPLQKSPRTLTLEHKFLQINTNFCKTLHFHEGWILMGGGGCLKSLQGVHRLVFCDKVSIYLKLSLHSSDHANAKARHSSVWSGLVLYPINPNFSQTTCKLLKAKKL